MPVMEAVLLPTFSPPRPDLRVLLLQPQREELPVPAIEMIMWKLKINRNGNTPEYVLISFRQNYNKFTMKLQN